MEIFITDCQLHDAMPRLTDKAIATFFEPLNLTFKEFQINTLPRIAMFLAQVGHESLDFRYMEEIASGKAYENRADLGNTNPLAIAAAKAKGTTPGRFYKGHGPIQITGYFNHLKCGQALKLDLVNNPTLLTQPLHGCRAAGWYFNTHNCNSYADVGMFTKVTLAINGGYNGLEDRKARWAIARKALGVRV